MRFFFKYNIPPPPSLPLLQVMVRKLDEKMVLKIMVPLLMELSRDSEM